MLPWQGFFSIANLFKLAGRLIKLEHPIALLRETLTRSDLTFKLFPIDTLSVYSRIEFEGLSLRDWVEDFPSSLINFLINLMLTVQFVDVLESCLPESTIPSKQNASP